MRNQELKNDKNIKIDLGNTNWQQIMITVEDLLRSINKVVDLESG